MSLPPTNCPRCSAPLLSTDEVCPFCGCQLSAEAATDAAPPPPLGAATAERPPREATVPQVREAPPPPSSGPSPDVGAVATESPPWERWREFGFFKAFWLRRLEFFSA